MDKVPAMIVPFILSIVLYFVYLGTRRSAEIEKDRQAAKEAEKEIKVRVSDSRMSWVDQLLFIILRFPYLQEFPNIQSLLITPLPVFYLPDTSVLARSRFLSVDHEVTLSLPVDDQSDKCRP